MSAPRILHVFSTFAPAGPELRAVSLMRALGDSYQHAILAIDGCTDAARMLPEREDIRVLEAPPRAGTMKTVRRLRAIIRAEQPDLVCTYNWGAMDGAMAAVGCKVPVLHHEDGFNADEAKRFKRRRVWWRRRLLPLTHRVIVPSVYLEKLAVELWKLKPEKVQRIPNGIDPARFEAADGNAALRAELGIPQSSCLIGFMGHLRPVKNAARLLEAAAPLAEEHDLHLLIIGDGRERSALELLAAEPPLRGRVHFTGHLEDPRSHLRAMDIFALSSDSEQHPIALLEAMACSLCVASTRVGDVEHILTKDQQPLISSLEAGAGGLSSALRELILDEGLRRSLGQQNAQRVREIFTHEAMLEQHAQLWRSGVEAAS